MATPPQLRRYYVSADQSVESESASALRLRALSRAPGSNQADGALPGPYRAFRVLHDLAMSPATADDALALLHELQVHQVELDLQQDDLRSSRAELELALARQRQLYDAAPVACFTIERNTALVELNLAAASLLGDARDALTGRHLDGFLDARSADALHTLLSRTVEGRAEAAGAVALTLSGAAPRRVHATASVDPAGSRFFVAFTDLGAQSPAVGN